MYNVLIVDDQKSSRDLLRYVVLGSENYKYIGALEDAEKAEHFCRTNDVDVILMDIQTSGKETGIKSARKVKAVNPSIKIIIVTFLVWEEHIELAKEAGCEGFWYKDYSSIELLEVMNRVMCGEIVYPDETPSVMIGLAKASEFTKQELAVLKLIINGASHAVISEKLGIKKGTVDYHIKNIKEKTGYDNILKLAIDISTKKFMIADELTLDYIK